MWFDPGIAENDARLAERHARANAGPRRFSAAREHHLLLVDDIYEDNRPAIMPSADPAILPPNHVARQPRQPN